MSRSGNRVVLWSFDSVPRDSFDGLRTQLSFTGSSVEIAKKSVGISVELINIFGGEAMDLNVGQHCSVASCNVNDLLPIQCLRCKSHFCREHFGIDHHDCSGTPTADDGSSSEQLSAWVKRPTCSFGDCNKPTLASALDASGSKSDSALNDALCPQCSEAFCVT